MTYWFTQTHWTMVFDGLTQFSQEWARRKVVVEHSIKSLMEHGLDSAVDVLPPSRYGNLQWSAVMPPPWPTDLWHLRFIRMWPPQRLDVCTGPEPCLPPTPLSPLPASFPLLSNFPLARSLREMTAKRSYAIIKMQMTTEPRLAVRQWARDNPPFLQS